MKAFKWVVGQVAASIIMWWALVEHNVYAENLTVFMWWVHLASYAGVYSNDNARKKAYERGPAVPLRLSAVVDLVYVGALAACGWWWTAIAALIVQGLEQLIYGEEA